MQQIQLLSAPSSLSLRSGGVESLAPALLQAGLAQLIGASLPVVHIPTLNDRKSRQRDPVTQCLNPQALSDFSVTLGKYITATVEREHFPFVLGGDCSVLLGILQGLRSMGRYGLIFIDAHADFYSPEKSVTGEVADMDLAIATGHGPTVLTDINGMRPYVAEKDVVHIAQRDQEEAAQYGSPDIRETAVQIGRNITDCLGRAFRL